MVEIIPIKNGSEICQRFDTGLWIYVSLKCVSSLQTNGNIIDINWFHRFLFTAFQTMGNIEVIKLMIVIGSVSSKILFKKE